jgi:hypothetical protein
MMYHDEHDKKALNALAADMGLHDPANVDAALGLPLVMLGSDATDRLNALTENGTKPGAHTASRTDAASLSNVTEAKHKAAIAYAKLLRTLTTQAQKDAACDYMAVELEVMDLLEGGAK